MRVVYKPTRGERPLDDFPYGTLAARERAAYLLSEASGWRIVPPTVVRDGPLGEGMVQLWIEVDDDVDLVDLINDADPRLRRIALFDAIANNADRKVGHLLALPGGPILGRRPRHLLRRRAQDAHGPVGVARGPSSRPSCRWWPRCGLRWTAGWAWSWASC